MRSDQDHTSTLEEGTCSVELPRWHEPFEIGQEVIGVSTIPLERGFFPVHLQVCENRNKTPVFKMLDYFTIGLQAKKRRFSYDQATNQQVKKEWECNQGFTDWTVACQFALVKAVEMRLKVYLPGRSGSIAPTRELLARLSMTMFDGRGVIAKGHYVSLVVEGWIPYKNWYDIRQMYPPKRH